MTDRCVVLIDAGYLLGAVATKLTGRPNRDRVSVDHAKLLERVQSLATQQTGKPLLRILWYDAARDSRPTAELRKIGLIADVKVRLGDLHIRRDGEVQKGVDAFLQRDLTTLARNHAISDAVLVTGDDDMRRSVDEAQDFGVRVHLWGVDAGDETYNQSQNLIGEADRRFLLRLSDLDKAITESGPASAAAPDQQPAAVEDSTKGGHPAQRRAGDHPGASRPDGQGTPAPPKSGPAPAPENPASLKPADRAPDVSGLPKLRDISTAEQRFDDREHDVNEPEDDPEAVASRFADRWESRASDTQISALVNGHPRIPHNIDGELLAYAQRSGVDTWNDEEAKKTIRAGFWQALLNRHPEDPRAGGNR